MHTSSSSLSTASSSSSSSFKPHKRKWTREQLLKHLELLESISDPLPSTLPPSPPSSRCTSPAPGTKRKIDSLPESDNVKRLRTSSLSSSSAQNRPRHTPAPQQAPSSHLRESVAHSSSEPCEDGELREDTLASHNTPRPPVPASATTNVPIRRPRRGALPASHFDHVHDVYHRMGRKLKYSGDQRFWSTYPPTHKEYKPLARPPPVNDPYHKYGGVIAKLELMDALVCFTYALWIKDYKGRSCNFENWKTIDGFLGWCKGKWKPDETTSDAEKTFYGLIWMMESYILSRKAIYLCKTSHSQISKVSQKFRSEVARAIEQKASETAPTHLTIKSESTPQMLPSPASLVTANSANSTPTNRDETPISTIERATPSSEGEDAGPSVPLSLLPSSYSQSGHTIPSHITATVNQVTVAAGPQFMGELSDLTGYVMNGNTATAKSQQYLTLPILARCFPHTYARIIHSTLTVNDEIEPDIEDNDCELFWPGQGMSGEGLGWVCLVGQAMIREFGRNYGYEGVNKVVRKPV